MEKHRIESLDYLRGIMALSVMAYHYVSWTTGSLGGEYLLGKLGIYAVSIFYILSGLSLAIVYHGKITTPLDVLRFLVKRTFRIVPLFWLAVTSALLLSYLKSTLHGAEFGVTVYKMFLNYSLLFGFVEPTAYLSTGAWSIGNEMVFYTILPIVFLFSRRSKLTIPLVLTLSIFVGLFFAFEVIKKGEALSQQWSSFINPFNQLYLFMAGLAIGVYGQPDKRKWSAAVFGFPAVFCIISFQLYPASGDLVEIVSGVHRLALSALCISFVMFVYFSNLSFKSSLAKPLSFFGQGCYSIYILHPLIAIPIVSLFRKLDLGTGSAYIVAFIVTLVVSWFTFKYLEAPMMRLGKKVSDRMSPINSLQLTR